MSRGWGPAGGEVVSGKGQRKQGLLRIRRLGTYVEPYRLRLLGAIVAMFGVLGCTLALPLLMKTAIDSAILPGDTRLLVLIAAVVIVALRDYFSPAGLVRLYRVRRGDFVLAACALVGVLLFGVLPGVIIGVVLSLALLITRESSPNSAVLGQRLEDLRVEGVQGHGRFRY